MYDFMKRTIILLLIAVLLLSACLISPACAEGVADEEIAEQNNDSTVTAFLFKEKIEEKYTDSLAHYPNYLTLEVYDEPYVHEGADEEIDWALIRFRIGNPQGPLIASVDFGDVIVSINQIENVLLGMCVYDVKKDELIPITDNNIYNLTPFDYSGYDGFEDALTEMAKSWIDPADNIRLILKGDADGDKELTVLDATHIQRFLADLLKGTNINFEVLSADYDMDKKITIFDATAIQRRLAGLT